jgi:hypothetical protein
MQAVREGFFEMLPEFGTLEFNAVVCVRPLTNSSVNEA